MVTDPISDMLTSLRNAASVKKEEVLVPHSNIKMQIAEILKREGYLKDVSMKSRKNRKYVACSISYDSTGRPKFEEIRRMSKPSRRVYQGVRDIKLVRQGRGFALFSTPKGLMTDKEAREAKVGGEVLFTLW